MTSCDRHYLYTDIETFSGTDIESAGSYRYMEDPDFRILLLAYAYDDDPVEVLDLTPDDEDQAQEFLGKLKQIQEDLQNPNIIKIAHNCAFERNAYRHHFGQYQPPEQWEDTMILCAYNGLPMSLDAAGTALKLPLLKMKEGKSLITYFCKPCKPTAKNCGQTRNSKFFAPEKWENFKKYCGRDVETMREIHKKLRRYPVTDFERQVWKTDCVINERGVKADLDFVKAAIDIDEQYRQKSEAEMQQLTGLDNPNSVAQLKDWLDDHGLVTESLSKETIHDLKDTAPDAVSRRVLELRQLLSKTSTKKYSTMLSSAGEGGRIRGIQQYYGTRTGRWAGRLVQLQNLPQNHLNNIAEVRAIVKAGDLEALEMLFDSVPDTLSQLIRTALVAKEGHTFLVADYSAIEARVTAYLSGERWRMDVFKNGGDIYCASASNMFHVPVEKHGVNGHLRQKGKIAELALGYGGGPAALKAFGADKMGLTEDEMTDIVQKWRAASPKICRMWRDVETAAKNAIMTPGFRTKVPCRVEFWMDREALRILLPSGRILTYWGAEIDNESIVFMGQNQTTKQWEKISTWGGKLVENIVQAYARDCLATAMVRLEEEGSQIVFHVHDEVIVEAPKGSHWEDVAEVMGRPIDWAPGLLLRGDGYETPYYLKD